MNKREIWVVTLSSLLVICILFFLLFEIKEVPDVDWRESYSYQSKEPYGAWIFGTMLKEKFAGAQVLRNQLDTMIQSIETKNNLLVMISARIELDRGETESLMHFIEKGNEVLLFTEQLQLSLDEEDPYEYYWSGIYDSTLSVHYSETASEYFYQHYFQDFRAPANRYFNALSREIRQLESHRVLGTVSDSLVILEEWQLGAGKMMLHTIPQMFTNQAAKQEFYLDHFNFIFSRFDPDLVILDHMVYHTGNDQLSESPLQFILAHKSLRISYFLVIFAAVSFIIFKSKRRQKVIPTLETNANTSLEYVHTISNLFRQQRQHKKLIRHLHTIFEHHVRERYFINPEDKDFKKQLARKSRITPDNIEDLLDEFDRAEKKLNVGDEHLITLYRKLDTFFKNSK
ncbi:MAG: hypothetical protein KDC80_18645 [Saprospiraceae bacterium]|nr:hypothetical protein [Saprospiraceae bacterium]